MSDAPLFGPHEGVDDIESLLGELDPDDRRLVQPPPELWARIEAAIEDERRATVRLADRRSRLRTGVLAAAAAVTVLVAGAVFVASQRDDGEVVATAELAHGPGFDPLGADATAIARLVERDGAFEIRLDDASLPDPDADDLELWLILPDADGGVSDVQPVSLVDARSPGTYAVPAELDPNEYSIVDISIEPRDGDETHSGRSILRGSLDV